MSASLTLPDLPLRLTLVIHTLCRIIAARAGRDRAVAPLVLLTWPYLMRLAKRFDALVRRVRAGEMAPPRSRPRPDSVPRQRKPQLPQGFAWLIRRVPEAAQMGGQVRALLTDPDFSALLAEAPQAGKILRPLCRMLGISRDPDLPPALFRPPAPNSGTSGPIAQPSPLTDRPVPQPAAPDDHPNPSPAPLNSAPA